MLSCLHHKSALIVLGLLCLFATSTHAAIVNYDESIDGDLTFYGTTFNLNMAGTHTVSGSSSNTSSTAFDSDSFLMALAPGFAIVNFDLTYSNGQQQGITYSPQFNLLQESPFSILRTGSYTIATDTNNVLGNQVAPPYTNSLYRVLLGGSTTGTAQPDFEATWDWDATITTRQLSPVPVPAAVWLFGTALVGLFGFNKRRKAG